MTSPFSRFDGLPKAPARLILMLLVTLMVASLWPATHVPSAPPTTTASQKPEERDADLQLYDAIIRRMADGDGYYRAAAEEQRHRSYPLKPFVTFRLPTLAMIMALLGSTGTFWLAWALMNITLLVWYHRFRQILPKRLLALTGTLLLVPGMMLIAYRPYLTLHDLWAGMLITLSLGLYRADRYWPAWIAAVVAVLLRELALPYIMLMAAFALFEKRWKELAAWVLALAIAGFALFLHWRAVDAVIRPNDPVSPQWLLFGGPNAAMRFLHATSGFRNLSIFFAYPGIILSLFGWLSLRGALGLRVFLLIAGYSLFFMLTGRPNNLYWGLLIAPLLLPGLVFSNQAIAGLIAALRAPKLDLQPI